MHADRNPSFFAKHGRREASTSGDEGQGVQGMAGTKARTSNRRRQPAGASPSNPAGSDTPTPKVRATGLKRKRARARAQAHADGSSDSDSESEVAYRDGDVDGDSGGSGSESRTLPLDVRQVDGSAPRRSTRKKAKNSDARLHGNTQTPTVGATGEKRKRGQAHVDESTDSEGDNDGDDSRNSPPSVQEVDSTAPRRSSRKIAKVSYACAHTRLSPSEVSSP